MITKELIGHYVCGYLLGLGFSYGLLPVEDADEVVGLALSVRQPHEIDTLLAGYYDGCWHIPPRSMTPTYI